MIRTDEFNKLIRPIFAEIAEGDNTILNKKGIDLVEERSQNSEDFRKNCQKVNVMVEAALHKLNKKMEELVKEEVERRVQEVRSGIETEMFSDTYSGSKNREKLQELSNDMREHSIAQLLLVEKMKELSLQEV